MLHLLFFIELACLLVGCLFWRKQWSLQHKMLVLLMGLTVLVELVGYVLGIRYHQNNVWLYNLFLPLESASYICFFYLDSAHPVMKWLYRCLLAAIVLALVITWLKQPHFFIFNQYGHIAGLFLLLVAAAGWFIGYMLDRTEGDLMRQPAFWLATGVVPFCCMHIILYALLIFLAKIPHLYLEIVNTIANVFLYGGLTGCFFMINQPAPASNIDNGDRITAL